MKSIKIFILAFLTIFLIKNSIAQNWQWAKQGGSISLDDISSICYDAKGDVYVVGQFGFITQGAGYMIFDSDTVWNSGVNQIFVVKYSSNGSIIWAKGIGGNNPNLGGGSCSNCEYACSIVFDSISNSLVFSGRINGTVNFGNVLLNSSDDLFLAKMDLNGSFIWTKEISCLQTLTKSFIETDPSGNIFVAGYAYDSVAFDSTIVPPGGYIVKYSPTGILMWAKRKFVNAIPTGIKIDKNKIYMSARTINDTASVDKVTLIYHVTQNMCLSKFNIDGNLLWVRNAMSNFGSSANGVTVDNNENVFVSGGFSKDIDFGATNLTNSNMSDFYLAKYDSSGNFIWAKQSNATFSANTLRPLSSNGFIYLAGSFSGSIMIDNFTLTTSNINESFLACFDNTGSCIGAIQFGTSICYDYLINGIGESILGGSFTNNLSLGGTSMTAFGANDIFIAKHDAITGIRTLTNTTNNQLYIHANPNEGKCNITIPDEFLHEKNLVLSIYNSSGKLIQQKNLEMNEGKIKLSLEAEAKGLYNAVLSNGTKSYSGKIVFE